MRIDNAFLWQLRNATARRQAEWDPQQKLDHVFLANALAGEAGEACNVLKKIEREQAGAPGSRADLSDLAKELSDVVIYADALAMKLGAALDMDLPRDATLPPRVRRPSAIGLILFVRTGYIADQCWSQDRPPDKTLAAADLSLVVATASIIAALHGFNLPRAVAAKFDATSRKLGLAELFHPSGAAP